MKFYSQDGQDKFVADLLKHKKGGVFVDVGAYDGIYYSNTAYFEKELNWSGVCVEPNPKVFIKLRENRNCTCLNYCVSEKKSILQFLSVSGYGEMLSGLTNFFDQRHNERIDKAIKDYGGSKELIDIPSMPMHEIFEQESVREIDYLNIDVEGGEMSVLNSIDFSKVNIKVLTIENNYKTKQVQNFLKHKGYSLVGRLGSDEVYEFHSSRYALILGIKLGDLRASLGRIKRGLKSRQ